MRLAEYFKSIIGKYPKVSMHKGLMEAFLVPPESPSTCLFSKLSINYTADLKTRVEPCVFGGAPNCAECGCSMSMGMHWLGGLKVAGPLRARHLIQGSLAVGRVVNRALHQNEALRWQNTRVIPETNEFVQIER